VNSGALDDWLGRDDLGDWPHGRFHALPPYLRSAGGRRISSISNDLT
jgi:hypothetical protein